VVPHSPFRMDPAKIMDEVSAFQRKLASGMGQLRGACQPEYANTPRELVYSEDKLKVWHFEGESKPTSKTPLLIVYALVNTVWMTDLQADRSMVRNLLEQGEDVYLIDWGYPDAVDRWLTLDDYINGYLDRCVDAVLQRCKLDAIDLLGICQGGVFSLCYTALHPHKIRNLITMVTPVDFQTPDNMLSHWCRNMLDVDRFVDTVGNIPAALMNYVYLSLKPVRLNQQKYVGLVDILDSPIELENFLRMERWIFDSPDQAGEAFREFIKKFYQGNGLVNDSLEIGGQTCGSWCN
jgi:polyhydroxyalkanoate synthase